MTAQPALEEITKTASFVISIRQLMWIKAQTAAAKETDPGANDSKTLRDLLDRAIEAEEKGQAA